jgi:serine/threonine-protein kinase RsbW
MPGSTDAGTPARSIRVPSDLARVAEVRELVRSVAAEAGVPDATIADMIQAADEAATNSIIHGHAGRPGWLEVQAAAQGDRLVVTITDDAPPFDPTTVPAPDLSIHPARRRPGGMGVLLARTCVDEMSYEPGPAGGNILTLVRRFVRDGKEIG